MGRIENVYVGCCKADAWRNYACVSSVRYWSPDVPITLLKNETDGVFDTSLIQKIFNLKTHNIAPEFATCGFNKMGLLMRNTSERFLYIDNDIAFTGDVISLLEKSDEDVVVSPDLPVIPENAPDVTRQWFSDKYYNYKKLKQICPDAELPKYTFNCGHYVAESDVLQQETLKQFVEWGTPMKQKNDGVFFSQDQGIFNYLVTQKEAKGELTVGKVIFSMWGFSPEVESVSLDSIKKRIGNGKLIHWAGRKDFSYGRLKRGDILKFYEDIYFDKAGIGALQRRIIWLDRSCRDSWRSLRGALGNLKRRVLGKSS